MNLREGISRFHSYLSTNNHSPLTANQYRSVLEKLPHQNSSLESITPQTIQTFLEKTKGLSPSSRNIKKSAIRSFCKWCLENDYLQKDPSRLIRFERIPQKEAKYFSPEQISKFRIALKGEGRNEILFLLYLETGLRLSEGRSLNVSDVRGKEVVRVIGKGNKSRDVFLSQNLQKMIAEFIRKRKDGPLFLSSWKKRLGSGQISWLMKFYCRKAGIPILSPHSLRHTFGTMLYEKTKDIRLTQELLGHSSPAMTMRYSHINSASKQEAIAALWGN